LKFFHYGGLLLRLEVLVAWEVGAWGLGGDALKLRDCSGFKFQGSGFGVQESGRWDYYFEKSFWGAGGGNVVRVRAAVGWEN
jgi:hypothetical protein